MWEGLGNTVECLVLHCIIEIVFVKLDILVYFFCILAVYLSFVSKS